MIKLYISAIESKEDGTAVTLFEDYLNVFDDADAIRYSENLCLNIATKLDELEAFNNEQSNPL